MPEDVFHSKYRELNDVEKNFMEQIKSGAAEMYRNFENVSTPNNGREIALAKTKLEEAVMYAKKKGDIPDGMERIFAELHESKVNWKVLLRRYLMSYIPRDYTYAKPSKKSISVGVYMPDTLKEKIDVAIGIDVSGSIGQKELTDFISEIVGMAREFRETIGMRLFIHDVAVSGDYKVENGNVAKIKQIKINGGGGTSHVEVMNIIKDKVRNCKVAVFLTDGESDLQDINMKSYPFAKIFVLSKDGTDRQLNHNEVKVVNLK